jgi:hypothetical protein
MSTSEGNGDGHFIELRDIEVRADKSHSSDDRGSVRRSNPNDDDEKESVDVGYVSERSIAVVEDPNSPALADEPLLLVYRAQLTFVGLLPVDGSRHALLWWINWLWRLVIWAVLIAYSAMPPHDQGVLSGRIQQLPTSPLARVLSAIPIVYTVAFPLLVSIFGTERGSPFPGASIRRGGLLREKFRVLGASVGAARARRIVAYVSGFSALLSVVHALTFVALAVTGVGTHGASVRIVAMGLLSAFLAQEALLASMLQVFAILSLHVLALGDVRRRIGPLPPRDRFDAAARAARRDFCDRDAQRLLASIDAVHDEIRDTAAHLWWALSVACLTLAILLVTSIAGFVKDRSVDAVVNMAILATALVVVLVAPSQVTRASWQLAASAEFLRPAESRLAEHQAFVAMVRSLAPGYLVLGVTISYPFLVQVATTIGSVVPIVLAIL